MTTMGLEFLKHQEAQRANRAREAIQYGELDESKRYHSLDIGTRQFSAAETQRHNQQMEQVAALEADIKQQQTNINAAVAAVQNQLNQEKAGLTKSQRLEQDILNNYVDILQNQQIKLNDAEVALRDAKTAEATASSIQKTVSTVTDVAGTAADVYESITKAMQNQLGVASAVLKVIG